MGIFKNSQGPLRGRALREAGAAARAQSIERATRAIQQLEAEIADLDDRERRSRYPDPYAYKTIRAELVGQLEWERKGLARYTR